ncbi:hypothetical protein DLD82_08380 [Methanospirillum stamsii]|uniref:Uncharacterized protein n=2 Tax=Methanospirillum stamsii TaxID=1277351 RepID=A0A2V2N7G6_9EURY|nr:hypothetical protein DLD82_08380 [Methanospirillum stamsii]
MLSTIHLDRMSQHIISESTLSFPSSLISAPDSSETIKKRKHRILIVDDEPALLEIARLFLEKSGNIEAICCSSALEGLSLLLSESFDAIVSDFDMPDVNGIEFLSCLRSNGYNIPFILFTGRGREEVVIEALNRGASYYIRKGGSPKAQFTELSHVIHQAVIKNRYEEKIRESERLIYSIFHHLPDPAYAIDTRGCVLAWNHGMEELTGVNSGNIIGKSDYSEKIPFYASSKIAVADTLIHSGVTPPDSWTILEEREGMIIAEVNNPDSCLPLPVTFRVKSTHLYDPEGCIIGAIESFRDVSREKQIQADLSQVNHYHRTLIETHIDPLVTISHDLTIWDVNAATENMIGFSRTFLIGTDISRWFLDPDEIRTICNELLYGENHVSGYPLILKCKGKNQKIFLYATSCPGLDGKVSRIFAELHEPIPFS